MNTDLLENIFGISCVENYYLSVLKFLDLPFQSVFYKSYVPLLQTVHDFIDNKFTYLQYYKLERVFVTGKKIGLMQMHSFDSSFDSFMKVLENNIINGLPLLAMVDYNKLPKQGNIAPWREDHFVSVIGYSDTSVVFLDDTPTRKLEITKALFEDAFMSRYSYFDVLDENKHEEFKKEAQLYIINSITNEQEIFKELVLGDENLLYFRDAIGILRISRNRIKLFLKWFIEDTKLLLNTTVNNLELVINRLDNLFSIIEAYRLRKKIKNDSVNALLLEIFELDYKWKNELSLILKNSKN